MIYALRILSAAAKVEWADFRIVYSWPSWIFGWLLRLFAQVTFFAAIGSHLGSPDAERYIIIGNAVAVIILETTLVVITVAGERAAGTLPLLMCSPSGYLLIYLGRGLQHILMGLTTSSVILLVAPWLLGIPIPVSRLPFTIILVAVIGLSGYTYGCFLAALVIRFRAAEWLVLNVGFIGILSICGVNVPTAGWPVWIQAAGAALPLTHGLTATRAYLDGSPATAAWPGAGAELLVAAGWLLASVLLFRGIVAGLRRNGPSEAG
jgi:ABC-2 type transport system permease protein